MKGRYKVKSFYIDTLVTNLTLTPASTWATVIPVTNVPVIEDSKFFHIILKPTDASSRLVLRAYMDSWSMKVNNWDITSAASFITDDAVAIFDVAELYNASYNQIDDFWYAELKSWLVVRVYWGYLLSWGIASISVPTADLTMTDNITNYIYCNASWSVFLSSTATPIYPILAIVVTSSWAITSITDTRPVNLAWGTSSIWYFHDLLDTFDYAGNWGRFVKVKVDETWLEALDVTATSATNTTAWVLKVADSTQISASTSTTPAYAVTTKDVVKVSSWASDENKLPVLNSSWQLDNWFISSSITWSSFIPLIAWENISVGDNLCFSYTAATENPVQVSTDEAYSIWKTTKTNIAFPLTMSSVWYSQKITTVKIDLSKAGSPTDNLTVSIYNDDFVTVVDTSNTIAASTLSWSQVQQTFTFSWAQNLIPWKKYYLVLRRSWAESDTDYIKVSVNTTGWSWSVFIMTWDWGSGGTYQMKYDISVTTYAIDVTTVKKMDANDPLLIQDAGIALEMKTTGQTVKVQMNWVVAWLSGLTPNLYYYASDTAGALSTTPSATYNVRIGKAISTTQLLIDRKKTNLYTRRFQATDQKYNGSATTYSAAYADKYIRVYTGFRPNKITAICAGGTSPYFYSSTGFSDSNINTCNISGLNNATHVFLNSNTVSFYISNCWQSASLLSWTIIPLEYWYEVKYSKTWANAFDNTAYINLIAE